MNLRAELKVEREEILVQENPLLFLTVTNVGPEPVRIEDPQDGARFRVLDLRTGEESMPPKASRGIHGAPEIELAPGKNLVSCHSARTHLSIVEPGDYEVTAVLTGPTLSSPARIRVRPVVPRNLSLDTVQGGDSFGVWVDLASDPPRIVRSLFSVRMGGGVEESLPIAVAHSGAEPIPSLPPNGQDRMRHWVGWLEGRELRYTHVSRELGVAPTGRLEVGDARLFAPLAADPVKDTRVRPSCWAVLSRANRILLASLSVDGASIGPSLELEGPPLSWARVHTRSKGERFVTGIQGTSLQRIPWSPRQFERPQALHRWEGEFVAAGALLDLEDRVRGAVLLRRGDRWACASWELDATDEFRVTGEVDVPWESTLVRAQVRPGPAGTASILLRNEEGVWSLFDGATVRKLPAPACATRLPMEPAYLGPHEPVLIIAESRTGFRISRMDGRALPRKSL